MEVSIIKVDICEKEILVDNEGTIVKLKDLMPYSYS